MNRTANVRQKKRRPRKRYAYENNNNYVHTDKLYRGLRPFPGISKLYYGKYICMCTLQHKKNMQF